MYGFNYGNFWNNNFGSYGQNYSYSQNNQLGNVFNMFSQILMASMFGGFNYGNSNTSITSGTSLWNNTSVNTSVTNTGQNNITNIFNLIINGFAPEPQEPEDVLIIGAYSATGGKELTLEENIKDFFNSGSKHRSTQGGPIGGTYQGHEGHNKLSANDEMLETILSNLSEDDKNLTFDEGQAYIISTSGEILGTVSSSQVVENGDDGWLNAASTPTYEKYSNFEVLEDLGIKDGKWNVADSEESMGGSIMLNGRIHNVLSTVTRKATPLILDMNGDGIELTSVEDGVNFDLNGDGKTDQTAWTKNADDVFLVYDKDGNGEIDSGKELFGDQNGAENGFLELGKYDSNGDGKVDANDDVYSKLQTWSDANHNGKVDEGELKSLIDSNVKSLSTGFTEEYDETGKLKEDEHGNTIGLVGSFEKMDGTKQEMIDALLQYIG